MRWGWNATYVFGHVSRGMSMYTSSVIQLGIKMLRLEYLDVRMGKANSKITLPTPRYVQKKDGVASLYIAQGAP